MPDKPEQAPLSPPASAGPILPLAPLILANRDTDRRLCEVTRAKQGGKLRDTD